MKMLVLAALVAGVLAVPVQDPDSVISDATVYNPCISGLYKTPQCCSTDVLGVAGLDCKVPDKFYSDGVGFTNVCAAKGQLARCCVLPVLGQDILCQAPVGTGG